MSAPKAIEPTSVLSKAEWPGKLAETVVEVFSIMVAVNVVTTPTPSSPPREMTAVVGIAGAIRANLVVQCNRNSAVRLAAQMLGIEPDAPGSLKAACDALGEVCNIVAGYFKAKIGLGDACVLSVPTVITGQHYRIPSAAYERTELYWIFEGELVGVTLELAPGLSLPDRSKKPLAACGG